jgi:integrase/recombinase XerD
MTNIINYSKANIQVRTEQDLPPHITFDEFKKIYYSLSGKDQLLCGLMWETGGRISDVLNLRWKDIDFDTKIINMYVDKRDLWLNIPVSDMIISDLKNHYLIDKPEYTEFIFSSNKSKTGHLTRYGARYKVKQWEQAIGRPLHPHMWRHGLAIHLLAHGVNIKVIAARLGHSSVFTTMNSYLVVTPELQRQMIEHVPMR